MTFFLLEDLKFSDTINVCTFKKPERNDCYVLQNYFKIPHRIVLSWLDHKNFLKLRVNFFHYHYCILYFLYIRLYVFCLSEVSSDYFFIEDNATINGS